MPAFPWLQEKGGEAQGPLGEGLAGRRGKVTTRRRLVLGKPISHICPTFAEAGGNVEASFPGSKQGQAQPQLHPGIFIFSVPNPESPLQAGQEWFLHDRSLPLSNTLLSNYPVYGRDKNAESQGSDLGAGSGSLPGWPHYESSEALRGG